MGCILGFITSPYRFIRWGLESGPRGYIALGLAFIFLLVGIVAVRETMIINDRPSGGQKTKEIPDADLAPYMVETTSRVYYAELAVEDPETQDVMMTNYWERLADNWVLTNGAFVLEYRAYGLMRITDRG